MDQLDKYQILAGFLLELAKYPSMLRTFQLEITTLSLCMGLGCFMGHLCQWPKQEDGSHGELMQTSSLLAFCRLF
jgi:hypothetical protein